MVFGIDFGHAHPFAITAFSRETLKTVLFDEYVQSGLTPQQQVKAILDIIGRWHLSPAECIFYADPSGQSSPKEGTQKSSFDLIWDYSDHRIKLLPAFNGVQEGISRINGLFFDSKLEINKVCTKAIDAFNQAAYPLNSQGIPTSEKYEETFADILDSARYGLMGVKTERRDRNRARIRQGLGISNVKGAREPYNLNGTN